MSKVAEIISIKIDNQELMVEAGLSILQAARQNDIYIPALCAHKDLSPFGGCRLCIVEVEGMRGFPTSCTTPIFPDMIIRTHTGQLQAIRSEILQLILSEHPASCLICDESEECKKFMGTIRKAGVTTGCRYCPNDRQCELQEVVEKIGVKEISYPIYYRNLRVEKEDPFYDRDYNLCILCGRCIRMCQEIRLANTLAFKQRGHSTIIGPAFELTHLEAGCEFCGACVSVCPTGALYDKVRKWDGAADHETITTCALCGVGCQLKLLVKDNEIIGSLPANDEIVNNDQLCVKGRFGIAELVNNSQRLRRAYKLEKGIRSVISRDASFALAAEVLSNSPPDEFGMLISPNCTNEDLYVAQKFVRMAMESNNIDTGAKAFYGPVFDSYFQLMKMAVPLTKLQQATAILCIGLDTQYGRSVVGVALRRAIKRGAKVITINSRHHNLALTAHNWLIPKIGNELDLFESLVMLTETPVFANPPTSFKIENIEDEIKEAVSILKDSESPVILIGSDFLNHHDGSMILEAIAEFACNIGAGVMPLPAYNNLFGSIMMGAYREFLPGGHDNPNSGGKNNLKMSWNLSANGLDSSLVCNLFSSGSKLKVLYLVGEIPSLRKPACDFIIYQSTSPPPFEADLVIPAAAFTETEGTFMNGEGRLQQIKKAVPLPGDALSDWEIFCQIAQKMGKRGFNFTEIKEIHQEIGEFVPEFKELDKNMRKMISLVYANKLAKPENAPFILRKSDNEFPFLLSSAIMEHTYRGYPLANWVKGMLKLFPENVLDINPADAVKAGINNGDMVSVESGNFKKVWPARIINKQAQGTLHVTLTLWESIGPNPHPVKIRKCDV